MRPNIGRREPYMSTPKAAGSRADSIPAPAYSIPRLGDRRHKPSVAAGQQLVNLKRNAGAAAFAREKFGF
jgi:hypothetical protein